MIVTDCVLDWYADLKSDMRWYLIVLSMQWWMIYCQYHVMEP